ncbi:MAG TPA: rhomboid family intramembrane serine protease [Ktedonobacterales bacterium]|nr:rhomboid family intramembrane serine protease [Ktedonobacterales bacterium]
MRRSLASLWVAYVLMVLNVFGWLYASLKMALAHGDAPVALAKPINGAMLLANGAADGATVFGGAWWRLITAQFLHVQPLHLALNLVGLYCLGRYVETALGAMRFAAIYFGAGTLGMLASVVAAPALVSSGASQAILGLVGASLAYLSLVWRDMREWRWPSRFALGLGLLYGAIQISLDIATVHTVKSGHLAGLLAGFALGYLLTWPAKWRGTRHATNEQAAIPARTRERL